VKVFPAHLAMKIPVSIFTTISVIAATAIYSSAQAQNSPYPYNARSLAECYANAPRGGYFDDVARGVCDLQHTVNDINRMAPRDRSAPPNVFQDGIDYIALGRNIRTSYESPNAYIWADGARGFMSREGDIYRITKQVADDGNVVYYLRINSQPKIYRYNASQDSAGYTDVWSYSVRSGYLKCRVTMVSANGRYLSTPQITHVETQDMYPSIKTLLTFE
jgi:hypothetical protein